jgi:signal peptidase
MVVAVATGLLFGLLAATTLPLAFDAHPMTVMSGSMHPAIATGDAVVVHPIRPVDARVGEVITFRDPRRHGSHSRLITHRVRGIRRDGAMVRVVTRGDANNTSENWSVHANGEIGRVVYRIPRAGYVSRAAATPAGRVLLVMLPALMLGIWALVRVWAPAPAPDRKPSVGP